MSLFPAKYFVIALAIIFGFGFYTGLLHYDHDHNRCVVPRGWMGEWHTIYALGRLEFRVQDYGCDPEYRLDPTQWKYNGIQVVPIDNSSN